ncbi:hypothetical protein CBS101457_004927 [Exobasidium rhododendri]|nr:hypothetical protein CBS101457_004927 [Exobasidium rhododendri]
MAPIAVTSSSATALPTTPAIIPKTVPGIVKLAQLVNVDVDSMDPAVAKSLIALGVRPTDQTSNQILVGDGIKDPANRAMLEGAIRELGSKGWAAVYDRVSVLLCTRNIGNITGRVLLQSSPSQAYNTDEIVAHARRYAAEFEKAGISKDRYCIKIPATGPGMNAGPILLKDGIRTLGTSLFSVPQAIASSQAGCLYISPYFNEVKAHDMSTGLFPNVEDVAVDHPMAPRMVQMFELYKQLAAKTGKDQPLIKGASNITAAETLACAEMGVHHITILAPVLKELCQMQVAPNDLDKIQAKPKRAYFDDKQLSPRMLALMKIDPLAPNPQEFKLASIDVDYLANQGEKLEESIAQDPQTARRLKDALDLFVGAEKECKEAIEKVMVEMGV